VSRRARQLEGSTRFLTPCIWRADMERNYRAEMTALQCGHLAGKGVGNVPERPTDFCGRGVPKRPTFALISLTLS
jgi:hypothetical protein